MYWSSSALKVWLNIEIKTILTKVKKKILYHLKDTVSKDLNKLHSIIHTFLSSSVQSVSFLKYTNGPKSAVQKTCAFTGFTTLKSNEIYCFVVKLRKINRKVLTEIKEKIQKLSKCVISFILFCTDTTVKVLAVIHMANLFRFGDSVLT